MAEYIKYGFQNIPHDIRFCFPDENRSLYKINVLGTLADVGSKGFSKNVIRQILKQEDFEDDLQTKRFIKMVPARIKTETIEEANTLLSFYVEEKCFRGDLVKTSMVEDTNTPEFKESPSNINFPESSLQLETTRDCIIGVEHKNREQDPFVRCGNCNGSGLVKCERCGGSGLGEQYVAGNYASGEERIETGTCPDCHGRGEVTCHYCNGEGRLSVFAREYSLISSVSETVYYEIDAYYWNPWNLWNYPFSYHLSDYAKPNPSRSPYARMSWNIANTVIKELKECVSLRNKNRNTIETDSRQEVNAIMKANDLENAYTHNLTKYENGREVDRSFVVSLREQHYVIPAKKLTITLKNKHTIDFLVYQFDDATLQVASSNMAWGYLSAAGYFFSSIYYAFVRLGRAAYRLVVKP